MEHAKSLDSDVFVFEKHDKFDEPFVIIIFVDLSSIVLSGLTNELPPEWPTQEEIAHYARTRGCSDEAARRGLLEEQAKFESED